MKHYNISLLFLGSRVWMDPKVEETQTCVEGRDRQGGHTQKHTSHGALVPRFLSEQLVLPSCSHLFSSDSVLAFPKRPPQHFRKHVINNWRVQLETETLCQGLGSLTYGSTWHLFDQDNWEYITIFFFPLCLPRRFKSVDRSQEKKNTWG